MVINLIAGVKMPFPENLRNNVARTERVQLDTNGSTTACLRLDDKVRWCYEHIAPVGARAEMLRIRNEPVPGLLVGQIFQYVDDLDLDGAVDIGSTLLAWWVAPEVVLAMRWAWVGQVADQPITERPNENAPQGWGQPLRPRG
jgi:hypothetical protein